jgi:putative membrane protein
MPSNEESVHPEVRLHPLSVLFSLGGELRNLAIPALLAFFAIRRTDGPLMFQLMGVLVVALIAAVWRYYSFKMRYGPGELVIHTGIIKRNERHIPYHRIQSIDSKRNAFHQLFGVVEVVIQTAGSDEAEASLSVLPAGAVEEIRSRVFRNRVVDSAAQPADGQGELASSHAAVAGAEQTLRRENRDTILRLRTIDLLKYGFIENRGMFLVFAVVGLAFEFGPLQGMLDNAITGEFSSGGPVRAFFSGVFSGAGLPLNVLLYAAVAVAALLVLVRIISVLWAAVRMYDFTVTRTGDDLRVEYGLLTRIAGTIPMGRIQSVTITQNLAHRAFGCATVDVSTAGGGSSKTGNEVREPLAPFVPAGNVEQLLRVLWPELDLAPATWRPLHPRAHVRIFRSGLVSSAILALILALPLRWWAAAAFVVMCAWGLFSARRKAAARRWTVYDKVFAVRGGWLRRSTVIAWLSKIQVVQMEESLFDRRHGMAAIGADTGGASAGVSYLPRETAVLALEELSTAAASTRFRW